MASTKQIHNEIIYNEIFDNSFKPEPLITISKWSDENRFLSQIASSEPGRWRTSRTPYLKEIMDELSPTSKVEKVVVMKGVQLGCTELGNNWIGYIIDKAPGAILAVQPTVEMGKRWSKGRLAPLIEDTPKLRGKVKTPRERDSGNTVQAKEFPGGIIVVTGANSAVGLRSMPVRYLFLDEIDAYPHDANGEGDPLSLAVQRTATFARRKIFMASTPTTKGISRIEKEFNLSDKRYYHVPCPHCNFFQKLEWKQIKWEDNNPDTSFYECINCKSKIYNHHKAEILERGKWIAEEKAKGSIAGFHISSLYSPVGWFSWSDAVRNFLHAKNDEQLLKVWVNTTLGEVWVDKGESPEWERLYERAEDYPIGTIPKGGLFLTAGADVQKDRIEVEVVAWGRDKTSWSVEYFVLPGSPASDDVWQKLDNLLVKSFKRKKGHPDGGCLDGGYLKIAMLAIDSGYATQDVYNWVRRKPQNRVIAVKGKGKLLTALGTPAKIDLNLRGQKMKRSAKVWTVGTSILKSEFYSWLKLTKNDDTTYPKGYAHFPKYDAEYFKQLTAEQLTTKTVKGYPKREWQKMRDRNEALDCRVYARAAAIALGADYFNESKWDSLEEKSEDKSKSKLITRRPVRRFVRSSFMEHGSSAFSSRWNW